MRRNAVVERNAEIRQKRTFLGGFPNGSDRPKPPSISSHATPDRAAGHIALTGRLFDQAMWGAAMDVGGWLRGLGLDQYEANFRDNRVDAAVLPQLTVDDLKDIGVVAVGDRRKLLAAIAALAGATPPASSTALPGTEEASPGAGGRRTCVLQRVAVRERKADVAWR
jgi:hypothetical protein